MTGVEPVTSSLPRKCSTTELHRQTRAENGIRTRDPQLGRLMLYQLSYFRLLHKKSGQRWIRTTVGVRQQIYSLPHLATLVSAQVPLSQRFQHSEPMEGFEPTTC